MQPIIIFTSISPTQHGKAVVLTDNKNTHGGSRPGAGRRANDRKCMLSVRISHEAHEMLKPVRNKSEYIDRLIKQDYEISNSRQQED